MDQIEDVQFTRVEKMKDKADSTSCICCKGGEGA
jgi:hypothetical protein